MNAVEIEEAVSALAAEPFDADEFPFAFLTAFGNKPTTIKKLRIGTSNSSDISGGVLQRSNIHIATCAAGTVSETLAVLRDSPKTSAAKAKFILATDGVMLEAEELNSDTAPMVCDYERFPDQFGFFLPLAGITTVRQIKESSFDIRATGRLNKLYVELLKDNSDWGTEAKRPALNQFMARLIFCFFAEDTKIFQSKNLFTDTIEQMSDATNAHEVIKECFRAMNVDPRSSGNARKAVNVKPWADAFPYVNGRLFDGNPDVPKFTRISRVLLLNVGHLEWDRINPDIFGSMIQAVADDEERGELGMHYTSVPNILKVLNPLFLDDLREQLEKARDKGRALLNLRKRISKIRVFDPACGSGNFLVIAYKEMRAIEAQINEWRDEAGRKSDIPLTNFRGIELRDFPAEIARLALIIAEYQCDELYLGQKEALAAFLPLNEENWITCGNALRLDWLSICPPTGTGVKMQGDDLFQTPLEQPEIDFENEGGETYICGNPPYYGSKWQSSDQKRDLRDLLSDRIHSWKTLDYVAGWFFRAAEYLSVCEGAVAFVSTNSICQGQQVPILWPPIFEMGVEIGFAHSSFKWANLASQNAVVTVIIVGLRKSSEQPKKLYDFNQDGETNLRVVKSLNAYLIPTRNVIVEGIREPLNGLATMVFGNMPRDAGHLLMSADEKKHLEDSNPDVGKFLKNFQGSEDFVSGKFRGCVWITENDHREAREIPVLAERMRLVAESRKASNAASTKEFAAKPYRFVQIQGVAENHAIIIPRHTSEFRPYLPVGLVNKDVIVADSALAIYDSPIWNLAVIASRIHLVWIAAVCGKIKTDFRYSNTLGWNTFPFPKLTENDMAALTRCAEDILLARESQFPSTISDLYKPNQMPESLRAAHERNDEVLERIYIGRRFTNDTERLERLFDMYANIRQ